MFFLDIFTFFRKWYLYVESYLTLVTVNRPINTIKCCHIFHFRYCSQESQRYVPHAVNWRPSPTSLKIWGGFFCGVTSQRNDFELIPTVIMETRYPVLWDHLVMNFRLVQSLRSYGGLKSQDVEKNSSFFGKSTHHEKILKSMFRKYSLRHPSTCCVQILWNVADGNR